MARILTTDQALRAIYFDFEGTVGDPPSMLGWSFERDEGGEHFRQRIVERDLWSAAGLGVPRTRPRQKALRRTLDGAIRRMVTLAEEQDRLLVSWGDFDRMQILRYASDQYLVERACSRYRNALPTARQWLRLVHPDVSLDKTWSGKHRLSVYADIVGLEVPERYGKDVAAKGIRLLRTGLAEHGDFSCVPDEVKRAWKDVRGHNRLDCQLAREIVQMAAAQYWSVSSRDK